VERNISSIVRRVIQPDTLGADNKAVVDKVLNLWQEREIFSPDIIEQGRAELTENNSRRKGKRKAISPEVEERLKEMERFRHEHKKARRELRLRPKNDIEHGEFHELWEKATPDRRLASHFAGLRGLEGTESVSQYRFSPGERGADTLNRGRTPSPATPSTPYSPTVPLGKLSPLSHATSATTHPTLQPPRVQFTLSRNPPSTHQHSAPPAPLQASTQRATPFPYQGQESVSCPPAYPKKDSFYNPSSPTTP